MAIPELKAKSTSTFMEGVGEQAGGVLESITSYPRRVRDFLHDVRVEMMHVTWPSWLDVRATTVVVIVTVFFFGAYFFLLDSFLSHTLDYLFRKLK